MYYEGQNIDYQPISGPRVKNETIWFPGYVIIDVEPQQARGPNIVLIKAIDESVNFGQEILVPTSDIRPTTEHPNDYRDREARAARIRVNVKRAAQKMGHTVAIDAPIEFRLHGAMVEVTTKVFISRELYDPPKTHS